VRESDINKQNDSKDLPTEQAGSVQEASEPCPSDGRVGIPKFDLAEEIMAEQRKITAIRRKAPGKPQQIPSQDRAAGKKTEPCPSDGRGELPAQGREAESIGYTIQSGNSAGTLPEQRRIIAEIVARDIEKLRGPQSRKSTGLTGEALNSKSYDKFKCGYARLRPGVLNNI